MVWDFTKEGASILYKVELRQPSLPDLLIGPAVAGLIGRLRNKKFSALIGYIEFRSWTFHSCISFLEKIQQMILAEICLGDSFGWSWHAATLQKLRLSFGSEHVMMSSSPLQGSCQNEAKGTRWMCRVPFFLKRHRRIYGEVGANELQALFWSSFLINLDDAVILGDLVIQKTIDSLQTCVCVCACMRRWFTARK